MQSLHCVGIWNTCNLSVVWYLKCVIPLYWYLKCMQFLHCINWYLQCMISAMHDSIVLISEMDALSPFYLYLQNITCIWNACNLSIVLISEIHAIFLLYDIWNAWFHCIDIWNICNISIVLIFAMHDSIVLISEMDAIFHGMISEIFYCMISEIHASIVMISAMYDCIVLLSAIYDCIVLISEIYATSQLYWYLKHMQSIYTASCTLSFSDFHSNLWHASKAFIILVTLIF